MAKCPICESQYQPESLDNCTNCGWDLTPYPLNIGSIPQAHRRKGEAKLNWAKQTYLKYQAEIKRLEALKRVETAELKRQVEHSAKEKAQMESSLVQSRQILETLNSQIVELERKKAQEVSDTPTIIKEPRVSTENQKIDITIITQEACNQLARLVEECKNHAIVPSSKSKFNDSIKKQAEEELARKVNSSIASFIYYVSELYKIAAEHPTIAKHELILSVSPKINYVDRIGFGSLAAGFLGGAGALIGGIAGATIAGILSGGFGVVHGAIVGAQIVGTAGSALGGLIIFSDGNDQVSVKLDEEQLKNILTKGIAIIWGLSNKGYGHGRELSAKEAEYIQKQIYNKQKVYPLSNLTNSSEKDISEYSQKILKMLENPHQK